MNGKNNTDGTFNWKDALLDSGIMAGLTFFTSLGGLGLTGTLDVRGLLAAGIAAATQFFIVLAIKRGLREKQA
jgi:hypothetical protein